MESDGEKLSTEKEPSQSTAAGDMNINHDDLSDVSDLDDSIGGDSDDDKSKEKMDRANSDDEARSDTDIQQVSIRTGYISNYSKSILLWLFLFCFLIG